MLRITIVIVLILNIFYGNCEDNTFKSSESEAGDFHVDNFNDLRSSPPDEQPKTLADVLVKHKCIPTAVSRGPCHSCVCSDHGVFFCRPEQCTFDEKETQTSLNKPECDPNMLYNDAGLWCNCNPHGQWRSVNCRENFHYIRNKKTPRSYPDIPTNVTCKIGEFYAWECNVCECKSGILSQAYCTNRTCTGGNKSEKCILGQVLRLPNEICSCSEIGLYVDKLCVVLENDEPIQKLAKRDVTALTFNERNTIEVASGMKCTPDSVIRKDCNTCRCTSTGQMICTNKLCISSIGPEPEFLRSSHSHNKKQKYQISWNKSKLSSFKKVKSTDEKCTPGEHYRYKCNTCSCNNKGELTCTTMYCLNDYDDPALRHDVDVTKPNKPKGRASLPSIKKGEVCEPGKAYKMDCNVCRCTPSRSLICTKMLCLTNYPKRIPSISAEIFRKKKHVKRTNEEPKKNKKLKRKHEGERKKEEEKIKKAKRSGSKYPPLPTNKKCVPGEIYMKGCQRCFCNDNKIAHCTNKPCEEMQGPVKVPRDVFPRVLPKEFAKFTELPHEAAYCRPGRSYKINCNHCLCRANGNLLCNNLLCLAVGEVNRIAAIKASGKPCDDNAILDAKTEEDCITCVCKDRKTKCEPIENCTPYRLRRRNLHGELTPQIKPEESLSEDASMCMPGMVYRQSCNNCYCQEDGSLRCTRKGCLNYQQVKSLKAQRERLLRQQEEEEKQEREKPPTKKLSKAKSK